MRPRDLIFIPLADPQDHLVNLYKVNPPILSFSLEQLWIPGTSGDTDFPHVVLYQIWRHICRVSGIK